jgi:multiple sugar transport system substrate-binding protein
MGWRREALPTVSAAILAAALATGCGGVGSGGGGGDAGDRSLTTMGFGLPDEHATARVDAYKKAYPDVKVQINEGAFDEQQFLSAVASGSPPDVVYLDRDKIGSYAARGALQPMDSCVNDEHVDLSQYRDAALTQVKYNGKVYGIPEFATVRVLIVNNKAASAAGVDPTKLSSTDWPALQRASAAMAKNSGGKLSRIGVDPRLPETLPLWAKANGADLLSADGKTAHLDDPKVVEALRFAAGLVTSQASFAKFNAFKDNWDFFGAKNEYAADQVGAMPIDSWYVNTIASNSPDAQVTVVPFTDRQGQPLSYSNGQAWALPKGSKHPAEACRFAKTMTATATWIEAAKARKAGLAKENKPYTGTFTANKAADQEIFDNLVDPKGNKILEQGIQVVLSLQDKAVTMPPSAAAAEVQQAYQGAVSRVLSGKQDAQAALKQAQTEATAALQRATR